MLRAGICEGDQWWAVLDVTCAKHTEEQFYSNCYGCQCRRAYLRSVDAGRPSVVPDWTRTHKMNSPEHPMVENRVIVWCEFLADFHPEEAVFIDVKYSCRQCGLEKVAAKVPARTADVDVLAWTEQVMGTALRLDHSHRSPHCTSTTMSDVMIPIGGADRIGGPSVQ